MCELSVGRGADWTFSDGHIEQVKDHHHSRTDLIRISIHVMAERGQQPEFTTAALKQLATIRGLAGQAGDAGEVGGAIVDLTGMLWCPIDNDDSRGLDQLTVCELLEAGKDRGGVRLLVAIAAVDTVVKKGNAIDVHAGINMAVVTENGFCSRRHAVQRHALPGQGAQQGQAGLRRGERVD